MSVELPAARRGRFADLANNSTVNVHLPKDRISMAHQGYGFCEFMSEDDAEYACKIMNQIKLYGKPIRVNKVPPPLSTPCPSLTDLPHPGLIRQEATRHRSEPLYRKSRSQRRRTYALRHLYELWNPLPDDQRTSLVVCRVVVVELTPDVLQISRDPSTGASKGYGFISYDSFEAADAAIESMNNQFLMNKPVTVGYAFKKEGTGSKGDRHGTAAERLLAAQARKNNAMPMPGAPPPPPPPPGMGYGGAMMGGQGYGMPGMIQAPPPPPPGALSGANGIQMGGMGMGNGMIAPPPPPPFGFMPQGMGMPMLYNGGPPGQYPPPPPLGFQ